MFKKKPNIKNLAPLRSSDRRRTTDQIIADYGVESLKVEPVEVQEEGSTNTTITSLRNSLLPEGAQSAKFSTTVGPELKQVNGTVYVGQHAGDKQRILWIRLENKLIPTVYTLWRHPKLVPLLHTPDIVLQKMRGGADLMTPGLARGPPFPTDAKKGALVAIAAYENPSVPIVVGECEIDVSSLTEVRGAKGHAVKGIHWEGDELWDWGPSGTSGEGAPEHLDGWFDETSTKACVEPKLASLNIEDDKEDIGEGGVSLARKQNDFVEGEDIKSYEEVKKEWTTKDIDDAFWKAFLFSLHEAKRNHRDDPVHGIEFPIPQSQFMSHHVQPFLPIFNSDDASQLQIKKTSWKNIKKFIKVLDKSLLVKSKERNGGETIILDVDFNDRSLQNFAPYRLPKKDPVGHPTNESSSQSSDPSVGQKIKILQLYKPSSKLAPLFDSAQADIRAYYVSEELRSILHTYLANENLATKGSKLVSLDPVLSNLLFDSSRTVDAEVLSKGQTMHEPLFSRVLDKLCTSHYAITHNDAPRESVKTKSGPPPKIRILLETRSGNKTATRVSGMEPFLIEPNLLAEELQKVCAGATSVGQLIGSSPKNPVMEIMVQGPQKDAVLKALERRGIRKEWTDVVDKTKKGKGR